MSEHDVVVQKLDQILAILIEGGANLPTPNTAPTPSTSPDMSTVADSVQQVLTDAMGVNISSYKMNTTTSKGKMRIIIDIKE